MTYSSAVTAYGYRLDLTINLLSQSPADNSSTLSWALSLHATSAYHNFSQHRVGWSVSLDGRTISSRGMDASPLKQIDVSLNHPCTIIQGQAVIPHQADGSKTLSLQASISMRNTQWTGFSGLSLTGSHTLTPIPRTTALTPPGGMLGGDVTFHLYPASPGFSHLLFYELGAESVELARLQPGDTAFTWTPPLSLAAYAPETQTLHLLYRLETYMDDRLLGSTRVQGSLALPPELLPAVTAVTLEEGTDGITGGYIQYHSTLQVAIEAQGCYASTITDYSTTLTGVERVYTGAAFTTDPLEVCGEAALQITVTDSRGRKAFCTLPFTVLPYQPPRLLSFSARRVNPEGQSDDEGRHLQVTFSAAFANLPALAPPVWVLAWSADGVTYAVLEEGSGTIPGLNGKFYEAPLFSPDQSFRLRLTLQDPFSTLTAFADLPTAFPLLDLHHGGRGLAIGKVAETHGVAEAAIPIQASGGLLAPMLQPASADEGALELLLDRCLDGLPESSLGLYSLVYENLPFLCLLYKGAVCFLWGCDGGAHTLCKRKVGGQWLAGVVREV